MQKVPYTEFWKKFHSVVSFASIINLEKTGIAGNWTKIKNRVFIKWVRRFVNLFWLPQWPIWSKINFNHLFINLLVIRQRQNICVSSYLPFVFHTNTSTKISRYIFYIIVTSYIIIDNLVLIYKCHRYKYLIDVSIDIINNDLKI